MVRAEKITCRAIAVTAGLAAEAVRSHPLLDTDVTESATWNSANTTIATVTRGQVEGVALGGTTIEAVFRGTTGRANIEVRKNEADLIDGASGRYLVNGRLESNTCANTNPLTSYSGDMVIEKIGVRTANLQLSYEGRVQRVFPVDFLTDTATGQVRFNGELLMPFGSSSAVQSTRISAVSNSAGQITSVREEMSCGGGSGLVFRIDSSKFF